MNFATLNVLPAPLPLLFVPLATLTKTESKALIPKAARLVYVLLGSTQLLTVHASNPTAMLILSVQNASKVSSYVSNACPPKTESSSSPKAFVFVSMATTPTPTTLVSLARVDAAFVAQPPTALLALP